MSSLPHALYRAQEVRELDRSAIEEFAMAGATLMERAGGAVYRALRERWPEARRWVVLCGPGNNGGDGFVVARLAREAGLEVDVRFVGEPTRLKGDALHMYDTLRGAGITVEPATAPWPAADLAVDALFGTGLERALSGTALGAVEALNAGAAPIAAIDIPSGLHADTGRILGAAVRAHLTVTFIGLKRGLFTGEGPDLCGEIVFSDLGVPDEVYARVPERVRRISDDLVAPWLRPRARTAHKGQAGHVLVLGGGPGMAGAARMAGEAAARAGAGLVSVAAHPVHAPLISVQRPELMSHAVDTAADLDPLLRRASVVAAGPGLGRSPWASALLARVWEAGLPLVVDADALNLLAQEPLRRDDWVLTPHPGEAARLLACTTGEIQADRFAAVEALQQHYGGVALLKGAGTLVRGEAELTALCDAGNPGMASGGMGDVLTGVIAGLRAQGLSAWQAAVAGAHVHARAGDAAAMEGERGLLAGDLLAHLRRFVNPR